MSQLSPDRPARRAASRRKIVVEEDNSSDIENVASNDAHAEDDEGEYTLENAKPTKARTSPQRRATTNTATTPRRRTTTTRRTKIDESLVEPSEVDVSQIEPSQVFSPPESVADEPASPTKRSPPKRRSVKDARAARKSRSSRMSIASDPPEAPPALPTPRTSASPAPSTRHATPLADITESTLLNEQTPTLASRKMLDPNERVGKIEETSQSPRPTSRGDVTSIDVATTKLEKPMDIVVRTRAVGIPASSEPLTPKARMTITYLTLTNFKSYAGRQEVGPFHASFSSVVGPNGSGKSNVIDSLLFVFGFRASKMRQGKISALIHNSAQHPDLEYCEVEVHFQEVLDQADGVSAVVPDSQLVISRRAFKNNSSKYYINGRTSDFTTVTTLLKGRGIDLDHKRFLILQGEVESIAQMKPKAANEHDDGLLEYLEDIIGTSKYKTPIEEAAKETEDLNEVCLEKSSRVQHVEKEKNGLEDKKNKALAFLHNENELASKQSALYQIYVAECGDNVQVTEEAMQQIQAQLDEELQKHGGGEDEIKAMEKKHKKAAKDFEKAELETQALVKEVAKLDKEGVKFEEKKKFLTNKSKKLEKALETSKFGIVETETLAKQADEDVARLTDEIAQLEANMAGEERELANIRESLKGKTEGLSAEIASKQKQLEPWNAKVAEKQSTMAIAQSELDILREREAAGSVAVAEAETKMAAMLEQREAKVAELNDCEAQHSVKSKEAKTLAKQLERLAAEEPNIKSKLSGARQKADEARASLSATQSQGNVLSGLTRLKESGRVDGFHGRLGNLGAIDQKYDVAISTACPSLDNLVVDTVEVGQQCIDYLRKNNLGRANFILLDRLAQRDLSEIETPENVPRLFDLVRSKHERFRPAFFSVLQNTLVAKDLEQANRIAYGAKRWRVVTLDGQLIDKSGTMSGGGTKVAKGGMSSKLASDVTKDQVAKMEKDRDALEHEASTLQDQKREIEGQMLTLQAQLPKLETQAQKLNLEIESIDRNITDAKRRIQELSSGAQQSKPEKDQINGLERNIVKLQREVEILQSETVGLEDEIKALHDKIMEVGGVRLRSQKSKVDGLKEQIDTLNESMSSADVARAKADKQRIKHEKATNDNTLELEKLNKDIDKVDEDALKHTRESAESRKQAEDAEHALEERKDELQTLKQDLDALIADLNETRGVQVEMRNKLEENQKILVDNQKRLKYWQEKIGKLSLQNVSEDGEEREPEAVPELSRDELADLDKEELKASIVTLEEQTSQHVELSVLAEYRRRVNEHTSRLEDLNTALTSRDAAKKRTDDLRRLRLEGFMEGFSVISMRLKEMYQMITMGGNAELELVDSLDPFSEGILFSVMPPKKSWKNISNLSGGEKTLSSLALVFALHHYKPTPLYVMDEIDAALDFKNVSIVAAYIKERTKNAQFIVISLRNNMFELASRLVGVYKVNHMTKSVTIENRDYITVQG